MALNNQYSPFSPPLSASPTQSMLMDILRQEGKKAIIKVFRESRTTIIQAALPVNFTILTVPDVMCWGGILKMECVVAGSTAEEREVT